MAVQQTDTFALGTDRYAFDLSMCIPAKGWAQLDSRQDASYYGNWVNPFERKLVTYAEGDVRVRVADTDEEFVAMVRESCRWHDEHTGLGKIDGMLSPRIIDKFTALGLFDLLH